LFDFTEQHPVNGTKLGFQDLKNSFDHRASLTLTFQSLALFALRNQDRRNRNFLVFTQSEEVIRAVFI